MFEARQGHRYSNYIVGEYFESGKQHKKLGRKEPVHLQDRDGSTSLEKSVCFKNTVRKTRKGGCVH